ncbi:FAD-binding oxidoreductase [Limibacillus sp. MBR-115]|jgi:CDP-4-dehydro-6-deoxyglucose reductase/ferredoxin-NAD(P)+ reductase (naphthalene dioxygenase ferredoxin-specific)|uniref:FAD-binding oxidoreductase n=1 Tax=Limibacillus sp. MBR-115 TaxID=3156465 RepID=UPI00339537F2
MAISPHNKDHALPFRGRAKVIAKDALTSQVCRLRLELPEGSAFRFKAGQYLRLYLSTFEPRDYSIANQPDEGFLEFHIRDQGDGGASSFVQYELQPGDEFDVEGPFGACTLRPDHTGPILGIAGGTGLAPIKGIIEEALRAGWHHEVRLYFGVRSTDELYMLDHFAALEAEFSNFRFVPVAGDGHRLTNGCRPGLVTDALAEDINAAELCAFSKSEAYVAGPPAMVDATVALLKEQGLPENKIHADAFTLGPALPQSHDSF